MDLEPTTPEVTWKAPAKLNLTLEILGKRADGYHEIRSVFRAIRLHDTVRVTAANDLSLRCSEPQLAGPENLAYRAAQSLAAATSYNAGAMIVLEKRIPVAAGLGGGSSDAAAALLALDTLWGTRTPVHLLHQLAAALGSDVPFFLLGGTALAEGRGEILHPLPPCAQAHILLVKPPISVSTAKIYRMVTPDAYSKGEVTESMAAIARDLPPRLWPLTNSLQRFTCQAYPEVAEVLSTLEHWGASRTLMCGSGPTCFGFFESEAEASRCLQLAAERHWQAWVTAFLD